MQDQSQADELLMTLVERALTLPEDQRQAYLRTECAGDSELFSQAWEYVRWEKRMDGFLLDPVFSLHELEPVFEPGQLVISRFRIVREVAQGGMGIVWEAIDEKLERKVVAIKCAKPGFSQQLPPEVRNAREISHPNVCKIFEIHTASTPHGDVDFIVMEFLQGETLAERLRQVALPKKKARAIAQQLCAGLAEAHRKKVIHGDLKSNNVILAAEPDGSVRAVITDFGLARRPEAPGELVAGTPEYMAPELWQGAKPSMASDIYALGVILCELFSGAKPGELGSAASTLPLGDHHKQIPATENRKWNRVLARCLDPDPAHRFSSAEEVSRALGPSRARRWALGIAATVLLAAGSGIAAYFGALTPTEDVRLAVLPFEAGRNAEPLKEKLLRDVTDRVGRLKGDKHTQLEVIPLNNVLRKHADSVEKASAMLGATHVLRGTIETDKDQVKLLAFLTDARSRVDVKEWEAKYDTAQERYISGALASMVTDTFHLPPLARGPTNAAARGDYQAGLVYLRRDSTIPAALASFERAVHADPDSALAYAGLAEAQWFEYFLSKQRIWVDRSAESARQAECRNMDLAPVHRVMGLHLDNAGYYEQAEAEYRRAIELEPQDAENYRRLGQVYEKNNRKEEALAAFQTAVSLRPDYYRAHLELGAYHYNRGDYTRAIASFRQTVDLAPREPNARFALGATYLNSGMYAEAERQLRLAVALDESPNPLHSLGLALMYQARDDEAIGYFSRALRRNPESYLSWMYLGIADRRTNRAAESAEANMRGREVAEAEMARNPRNTYVRSVRGYFAAALGDRIRAESETAQAMSLAPDDAETRWAAILTYEALGEREASLAILNRSPRQQVMDISRWPDLADLQHDPRFLQLLAKFNLK